MTWRLAGALVTLRAQVNDAHPDRSKKSDGTKGDDAHASRKSDHNPLNGVVHALDLTHDPAHGFDSYDFADRLMAARDARVKYLISNDRFGGPSTGWAWEPYAEHSANGGKGRNKHDKHVHISVTTALGDQTQPWVIGPWTTSRPGKQITDRIQQEDDVLSYVWNTTAKKVWEVDRSKKTYRPVPATTLNWAPDGLVKKVTSDTWQKGLKAA